MGIFDLARTALNFSNTTARPAAVDPDRPNHQGYDHHMLFRLVRRKPYQVIREVVLTLPPESYSRTPEARLTVHQTAGGFSADIPAGDAQGLVRYVITGTTGVWPEGRKDFALDGMGLVSELRRLFEEYLRPFPFDENIPRHELFLEFINPDEPVSIDDPVGDTSYEIVPDPHAVQTSRSDRRASVWTYTIRLTCIARTTYFVDRSRPLYDPSRNLLERALDFLNVVQGYSFDALFLRYQLLTSPFSRVLAEVEDTRAFIEDWVAGVDTFLAYNLGLVERLVDGAAGIAEAVAGAFNADSNQRFGADGGLLRGLDDVSRSARRFQWAALTNVGDLNTALAGSKRTVGARANTSGRGGQPTPTETANVRQRLRPADQAEGRAQHTASAAPGASRLLPVAAGDTLEDMVPPGFTDLDVLRLNPTLRWPFVDGSRVRPEGEPPGRVVYLGESLRVPSATGRAGLAVASGESPGSARALRPGETDDERLFGRGLEVDPETRSLRWDPATGDVRTLGGLPNLVQRVRHALRLPLGALSYAPSLGSHLDEAAHGAWSSDQQVRLAAVGIQRTVRRDPSIRAVRGVTVTSRNGALHVAFEAEAIDGTPLGRIALDA